MTRINVGIDPEELPIKLLLAEHREIKRIPNCIKSGRYNLENIPEKFTLNTGHVKFFYKRIGYLKKRYQKIHQECLARNFEVTDFSESFENIPESFMGDYEETQEDRQLLLKRIRSKGFDIL